MRFTVESWDPDYGTAGDVDALDPSTVSVNADAESPVDRWAPVDPVGGAAPETVYFVDGVRRIDARIWVTVDGLVHPGSCATVAAGTVACTTGDARLCDITVLRGVFTPPAESVGAITTAHGTYEYFPIRTGSPEDLYLGIHEQMTRLETSTIPEAGESDLVVFDGPLRGRRGSRHVGLIKTQHVQYLPDAQQRIVGSLEPGQRSPLFLIGSGGFSRWSWYQRLPGPRTHVWAGIVRCEAPGEGAVDAAANLADTVTATLPRFASEPHKESRAPQNLYPIKGLELAMRRRLGDQRILHRALREASGRAG